MTPAVFLASLLLVGVGLITMLKIMVEVTDWYVLRTEHWHDKIVNRKPEGKQE